MSLTIKVTDKCVLCKRRKAVKWGGIWKHKALSGWCLEHWKQVGFAEAIRAMKLPAEVEAAYLRR